MITKMAAIFFLALAFPVMSHASLIRYDVSYTGEPGALNLGNFGYMVFDVAPGSGGNLWPNLVEWRFDFGSLVIDSSNTSPYLNSEFFVDSRGRFVSDGATSPFGLFSNPCFSPDACLGTGIPKPGFPFGGPPTSFPHVLFSDQIFPSDPIGALTFASSSTEFSNVFGDLSYSGPIAVATVGNPGSLLLISMILPLLAAWRRIKTSPG